MITDVQHAAVSAINAEFRGDRGEISQLSIRHVLTAHEAQVNI